MVRSERFSARRCRTKERSSGPTPARSERTPVGIWRPRRRTGPLGRRFLAKSFSQAADLGFWIAAVTPEGLQEGQLAFLGPAGHGLGRDVQEVGHLGGMEVAGRGGCGLAAGLGCHGASLSWGGLRQRCRARSGPVVRPARTVRTAAQTVPWCRAWCWTNRTIIETRPSTTP